MKPMLDDHRPRAAVGEPALRARRAALRPGSEALRASSRARSPTRYGDRVDRYILWNEPNLGGWLRPQAQLLRASAARRSRRTSTARSCAPPTRRCTPPTPDAQVLIGAHVLARRRRSRARTPPTARSRSCARSAASTRTSRSSRTGRCKGFKPAPARRLRVPPARRPDRARDAVPATPTTSRSPRCRGSTSALDKLQRAGRMKATTRRFDLYIDEYGYQTNPPDKLAGDLAHPAGPVAAARRLPGVARPAREAVHASTCGATSRAASTARYGGWQSGLRFADGRAKPALKHFATPFALDARARPAVGPGAPARHARRVTVERRLRGQLDAGARSPPARPTRRATGAGRRGYAAARRTATWRRAPRARR